MCVVQAPIESKLQDKSNAESDGSSYITYRIKMYTKFVQGLFHQ